MLTSAFRGFGGEHLVKEFLSSLPGGFWVQFLVVMLVIFFLGFFLDFIEISVVVVPIVAPILLADPQANITAVWLGVMLGLNLQTSFLTPPFGFALFYLRGVSPPEVQTTQIYRGAVAFIGLQIVGIMIAASYPPIVNYLPNRIYLTSDNAPPPVNPKIQQCLEGIVHPKILAEINKLELAVTKLRSTDFTTLPESNQKSLENSAQQVLSVGALIREIKKKQNELDDYSVEYATLHYPVRNLQKSIQRLGKEAKDLQQTIRRLQNTEDPVQAARRNELKRRIKALQNEKEQLQAQIPSEWEEARKRFMELAKGERKARFAYRRSVEEAYQPLIELEELLQDSSGIDQLRPTLESLVVVMESASSKDATRSLKEVASLIGEVPGSYGIKSPLSKARRLFRKDEPDRARALKFLDESLNVLNLEIAWRQDAIENVLPAVREYAEALKPTVGLRSLPRLSLELAKDVSVCQADHRDVSLYF
jgi:predicted  nucleic acid-binding Zn-ribbon protein